MPTPAPSYSLDLPHDPAVVMVVDWVESVRQIERAEASAIAHWRGFVHSARQAIEGRFDGRVVKSLGDGLLIELDDARQAVQAAGELHRLAAAGNDGLPAGERIALRVGLHSAEVYADDEDLYGAGVNLAARIATLAGPGETVVSETIRDGLTDGLDAEVEDLGECFLKHIDHPVRAYRVGGAGLQPMVPPLRDYASDFLPTVAVIPFAMRLGTRTDHAIGELVADAMNVHLGCSGRLRVISRLSTTVFRDRAAPAEQLWLNLHAAYALGGSYSRDGPRVHLYWELTDLRDGTMVAANRLTITVSDLLDPASEALRSVATDTQHAILRVELRRIDRQPMPTLESYTLLLGGVQLMHRSTQRDFERSFLLLSHLAEQHPRAVEPRVWLAKWYALRAVQGLSIDRQADARIALACTARALDREPDNSFALAMEGFVHCHLTYDFDAGDQRLQDALRINPSETFAHLFRGVIQGLVGEWSGGLAHFASASCTSPLDPARYLFDSIGAYLCLGAGRHDEALDLARRSLRANRQHAHTWRVMAIAQAETGDLDNARQSLRRVMSLQPELTVQAYLAGRPDDPTRQRFAAALQRAGLPLR